MTTEDATQDIKEPVKVMASFAPKKVGIHYFSWRGRTYRVDRANLFHIGRNGDKKEYHFSVSAGSNDYELSFDPIKLSWQLETVCSV